MEQKKISFGFSNISKKENSNNKTTGRVQYLNSYDKYDIKTTTTNNPNTELKKYNVDDDSNNCYAPSENIDKFDTPMSHINEINLVKDDKKEYGYIKPDKKSLKKVTNFKINRKKQFEEINDFDENLKDETIWSNFGVTMEYDNDEKEMKKTKQVERSIEKNDKDIKHHRSFVKCEFREFCQIIKTSDKSLINKVGKIVRKTPNNRYCEVSLFNENVKAKLKMKNVQIMSYDEYTEKIINNKQNNSSKQSSSRLSSRKEKVDVINKSSVSLKGQLYTNLLVTMIDSHYQHGKYYGEVLMIDNAYDIDECLCIVPGQSTCLNGIKSHMLQPVVPKENQLARVICGELKGKLLQVTDCLDCETAKLWDEEDEEDILLPFNYLCAVDK